MIHFFIFCCLSVLNFAHAASIEYSWTDLPYGSEVVELSGASRATLDQYFRKLAADLTLPDEATPKFRLVLFRPRSGYDQDQLPLIYLAPDCAGCIFWNTDLLIDAPSADVDRLYLAQAIELMSPESRRLRHDLTRTFAAAALGVRRRLLRIDTGEREGKGLRGALIHVESVIEYLQRPSARRKQAVDPAALVGGLKLAWADELSKRTFPTHATPRPELGPVIEEVRRLGQVKATEYKPTAEPKKPTESIVETIGAALGRLRGNYLEVFNGLEERRLRPSLATTPGEITSLLVDYQSSLQSLFRRLNNPGISDLLTGELSRHYANMSQLSPRYFSEWAPLLDEVPISRRGSRGDDNPAYDRALDDVSSLNFGSRVEDDHYVNVLLKKGKLLFDVPALVLGVSRLVASTIDAPPDFNFADRPLTYLVVLTYVDTAHALMRLALPPTQASRQLKAFRARLRDPDVRGFSPGRLSHALVELLGQPGTEKARWNLAEIFGRLKIEKLLPGFTKTFLSELPLDDANQELHFILGGSGDPVEFLKGFSEQHPVRFVNFMANLSGQAGVSISERQKTKAWWNFLRQPITPERLTAIASILDRGTWDRTWGRRNVRALHQQFTTLAQENWSWFVKDFLPRAKVKSVLFTAVDWDQLKPQITRADLDYIITTTPYILTGDHEAYREPRRALIERVSELVGTDQNLEDAVSALALKILNLSPATTPAGQELLTRLIEGLSRNASPVGVTKLFSFLQSVKMINFVDARAFVDLYATTLQKYLAPTGDFADVPFERLRPELRGITEYFEPLTAGQILLTLARAYRADPALKSEFTVRRENFDATNIDTLGPFRVWSAIVGNLSPGGRINLAAHLRDRTPLTDSLRWTMQYNLLRAGIPCPGSGVDQELRRRFENLTDIRRQMFLDDPLSSFEPTIELRQDGLIGQIWGLSSDLERIEFLDKLIEQRRLGAVDWGVIREHREAIYAGVDDLYLWYRISEKLKDHEILNLTDALRSNRPLAWDLRFELQTRLAKSNILIQSAAVETYLRARFRQLSPMARAGVFQLLMDGANTTLLRRASFRATIYRNIVRDLKGLSTRAAFVDVWEAGLKSLPEKLHSLVLSIALSESGEIGSPEVAVVTLLSRMGPLEQKFGQALAFSDIPESYRKELRGLWNNAQDLTWWQAWELIELQHGDLRAAGYTLSRILNSGSTTAYLEIKHLTTDKRLVISVYRDSVDQAVEVGAKRLRTFAAEMLKKNPRQYMFLPLLVEDSIRTITNELDPAFKEKMTRAMRPAYHRAAVRLGWSVGTDKVISGVGFRFTGIPYTRINTPGGGKVLAQNLAAGIPLQALEARDKQTYLEITRALLKLEAEVLNDDTAPIDKDRMPGQYFYDPDTRTVSILDHGQAKLVGTVAHRHVKDFVRHGFLGDAKFLLAKTEAVTGFAPPAAGVAKTLRSTEISVRPLAFLSSIADPYLAMAEGDPRREAFFDLVQGVRAHLRLLQWERSLGLSDLVDDMMRESVRSHGKIKLAATWVIDRATAVLAWVRKVVRTVGQTTRRMERAYDPTDKQPGPIRKACDDLLSKVREQFRDVAE